MIFEVGFDRLATQELRHAVNRYRGQSARAADRFVIAVDQALQDIAENPLLWPMFQPGFRWRRVRKFTYVLYFQIRNEVSVRVLAVAHINRKPGYWKRRAKRP
jgi:toxin ParE1/3/4